MYTDGEMHSKDMLRYWERYPSHDVAESMLCYYCSVFVESTERLMRSRVLTTAVSLCTANVVDSFVMDPCLAYGKSNYNNTALYCLYGRG